MSDRYKLLFRGEVLDGQHPAVVRKRLGEVAEFNDDALEKLFSGRPVVLKRDADTATAARLQGLFKKAGARLRVLPVEDEDDLSASSRGTAPQAATGGGRQAPGGDVPPSEPVRGQSRGAAAGATPAADGEPELLPAGSDILRQDERAAWEPRDIDTGDLALEGARFLVTDDTAEPVGPDVSHLTLAEAGSDLGPRHEAAEFPVQAPELELAEPGVDLAPLAAPPAAPVDFAALAFEVAPAGTDLGQRKTPRTASAPDTSHLSLVAQAPPE